MNEAIEFVNKVAPRHDKFSCDDSNPRSNARFAVNDFGGCYRCTILRAVQLAVMVERAALADPQPQQKEGEA